MRSDREVRPGPHAVPGCRMLTSAATGWKGSLYGSTAHKRCNGLERVLVWEHRSQVLQERDVRQAPYLGASFKLCNSGLSGKGVILKHPSTEVPVHSTKPLHVAGTLPDS